MEENKSYSVLLAELEEIVRQIDGGELEIDALSENIKRANSLIETLNAKLTKADEEVEKLLSKES